MKIRQIVLLSLLVANVPFSNADEYSHPTLAIATSISLDDDWLDAWQQSVADDFDTLESATFVNADEFDDFGAGTGESNTDESSADVFVRTLSTQRNAADYRMPGEFESQSGLMLSGGRLAMSAPTVLEEITRVTTGYAKLWVLVNDNEDLNYTCDTLAKHNVFTPCSFLMIQHDTMWARDFGPTVLQSNFRSPLIVDATYAEQERDNDDAVPKAIAELVARETRHTSLNLPGGNLLANGRGVILTTTRVQQENAGFSQPEIVAMIGNTYEGSTVAVLEPLEGESTGHVDMFATFTDDHTVVVGEYDRHVDSVNSRILDRNAQRLASIKIGRRTLRVVRIPMPARRDGLWPTFTNVVYANGLLLVPYYEATTPQQKQAVHDLYSSLLPGWRIHFIQCDDLINSGGALHCVISNLNSLSITRSNLVTRLLGDRIEPIDMPQTRRRLAFRN